jgi:ribosomal protein S14
LPIASPLAIHDQICPTFLDFVSGRLFRKRRVMISAEAAEILERLGSSSIRWTNRLERLRTSRWIGRFFAASRAKLREAASKLGVRHLMNLAGCPA